MLFDYQDRTLTERAQTQLNDHLEHCAECRSDLESLNDLSLQAEVWHDLPAPPWQAPGVRGTFSWDGLQQWFPSLASALALILVAGLYLQPPTLSMSAPAETARNTAAPAYGAAAQPVAANADANMDTLLTNNRLERQQELQALVQLLTAEMDRRNEETQESLRYVIAHQIQGQREIDDLYQYIRKVSLNNPPAPEQM
jgi:hypothetical protein